MDLRNRLQWNRRISSLLTQRLLKTGITPNAITLWGLTYGIIAGGFFAQGTHLWFVMGALSFHIAFLLDNCDGELARIKGTSSSFGMWLDMICDVLVDISLWVGLAIGASTKSTGGSQWLGIILIAAISGSLLNFGISIWERRKQCSSSIHMENQTRSERKGSVFFSILDTLCHNGDSAWLVWIFAAIGSHFLFLVCGAVYIHSLWLIRFAVNRKYLLHG